MAKIRHILISVVTCGLATSLVLAAPPISEDRAISIEQPKLLAQAETGEESAPTAEESAPKKELATGDSALARARELLAKHDSIRAKVVETIEMAGKRITATGRYLQQGKLRMHLEFEVKMGKTTGTLLEVCDGEILYTRHMVSGPEDAEGNAQSTKGNSTRLTRRNVKEILALAEEHGVPAIDGLEAEMGLGGLAGLLAALQKTMVFDVLQDETIDDQNVWMIQGKWTQEMFDRWAPPQPPAEEQPQSEEGEGEEKQPKEQPKRELPPLIPDVVRIYLDRQTGFPLKIQYLKKVPGRKIARPLVTLAFRDIELNTPIDESEFVFVPPETPRPQDITAIYRNRIQAEAQRAAQAKEAAAQEKAESSESEPTPPESPASE